jgi:hypothetical protein
LADLVGGARRRWIGFGVACLVGVNHAVSAAAARGPETRQNAEGSGRPAEEGMAARPPLRIIHYKLDLIYKMAGDTRT